MNLRAATRRRRLHLAQSAGTLHRFAFSRIFFRTTRLFVAKRFALRSSQRVELPIANSAGEPVLASEFPFCGSSGLEGDSSGEVADQAAASAIQQHRRKGLWTGWQGKAR